MALDQSTAKNDIQIIAYQLWESEGRPEGQESRHWLMAEEISGTQTNLSDDTGREMQSEELDVPGGSENTSDDTETAKPLDAIEMQEPDEPEKSNGLHH